MQRWNYIYRRLGRLKKQTERKREPTTATAAAQRGII